MALANPGCLRVRGCGRGQTVLSAEFVTLPCDAADAAV